MRLAESQKQNATLSSALKLAEQYETERKLREQFNFENFKVITNEKSDVLDLPAPATVVRILRPDQSTSPTVADASVDSGTGTSK